MKHVVLAWQCFQKLTDARGAFTHSPCVYVQIDSNSGPVRIGKASKHSYPNWLLKIRNLDSIQVRGQCTVRRPEAAEGLQNRPSRARCAFHVS